MGDLSKKKESTEKGKKKSNDPLDKKKQGCVKPIYEKSALYIMATCDWEGRKTGERSGDKVSDWHKQMKTLRKKLKKLKKPLGLKTVIPITHFMTPRTDSGFKFEKLKKNNLILDEDEIGLHIHCWDDLLKSISISKKEREDAKKLYCEYPRKDHKGHLSPLVAFDKNSIKIIVETFKDKLIKMTGETPVSFRAGAWMTSDDVYEALGKNGISIDSSPLPYDIITKKLYTLDWTKDYLTDLWGPNITTYNTFTYAKVNGEIKNDTQPYKITTKANNEIIVFPMTWGMDVNASESDVKLWAQKEINEVKKNNKIRFVNLGFHDTTIDTIKDWLYKVLSGISQDLQTSKIQYEFVTMKRAAAIAKHLDQRGKITL